MKHVGVNTSFSGSGSLEASHGTNHFTWADAVVAIGIALMRKASGRERGCDCSSSCAADNKQRWEAPSHDRRSFRLGLDNGFIRQVPTG
jgi:hypothetical protein